MSTVGDIETSVTEPIEKRNGSTKGRAVPVMTVEDIRQILPHRYPFLLVDKIMELEPGKSCLGIKNVTVNEQFFQGHFPTEAIMPGVLIIEAMAQLGGVMMLAVPEHRGKLALIGGIDKARFKVPVLPGDTLHLHAKVLKVRGDFGRVYCHAVVDGVTVAEAEILFALRSS
jgi:3-hydroxyacyl-[acyl-carrier-protein] dehydratase